MYASTEDRELKYVRGKFGVSCENEDEKKLIELCMENKICGKYVLNILVN